MRIEWLVRYGVLITLVGCTPARTSDTPHSTSVTLQLSAVGKSCRREADPLSHAAVLRYTVFGPNIDSTLSQTSMTVDRQTATIPQLPLGRDRRVVVEAFDASSALVAR